VRALEEGNGRFLVSSADDAPAGARGNGRNQPALVGICVEQQERACRFFAHFPPFAAQA
jgi:hypothetical protein